MSTETTYVTGLEADSSCTRYVIADKERRVKAFKPTGKGSKSWVMGNARSPSGVTPGTGEQEATLELYSQDAEQFEKDLSVMPGGPSIDLVFFTISQEIAVPGKPSANRYSSFQAIIQDKDGEDVKGGDANALFRVYKLKILSATQEERGFMAQTNEVAL